MSDLEVNPSNLQEYTLQRKPILQDVPLLQFVLCMYVAFNIQPTLEFPLWLLSAFKI